MKYIKVLSAEDKALSMSKLSGFLPDEVFDIHAHSYKPTHFSPGDWPFLEGVGTLGCAEHRNAILQYMPVKKIHGLYFGMPHRMADRKAMNKWVGTETRKNGTAFSRSLMVVSPDDDPLQVAELLRSGLFCGIKVYHCYAARPDTMNASISEFAPEWMWELLQETHGILMLHIVCDGAIGDIENQKEIRRLCLTYPKAQLVLAHIARSFNYRNARNGLRTLADLDNVVVDTSAICEAEAFRAALQALGPSRMLWGSDYPVSEMRGRCVTTGSYFFWLHPEVIQKNYHPPTSTKMTMVGLESLLCLREACDDAGLTKGDIANVFLNNALRLLEPHLSPGIVPKEKNGPALWNHARTVISGGTGLRSKQAEMFGSKDWPSYFSRCSGCEVWDMEGRRFIDFAGGIGAVFLGYADEDVTKAVQRRIILGTYCSLGNPQEVLLADKLLELHPWAGKIRYARGGGEAMAVAVRIARSATGRSGVAFCGYHGWHDWYLAANIGDSNALDGHLLPGLPPKGVPRELKGTSVPFRYNDPKSFENALQQLGGDVAAVVMEPMRSELPIDNFVSKVAARCQEIGAVFIVDEITSGLRYGFPGALSKIGIVPDMVVYAKAMSNGFPFAAIIGREEIMTAADESFISSSYWTDGVGPAAALAVLEKMQRLNVQEIVWKRGEEFLVSLKKIAATYPSCGLEVVGMAVLPRLNFHLGEDSLKAKAIFVRKMQEKGFLVSSFIYLMYAHEERHMTGFLTALGQVLKEMDKIIGNGKLSDFSGDNSTGIDFARLT